MKFDIQNYLVILRISPILKKNKNHIIYTIQKTTGSQELNAYFWGETRHAVKSFTEKLDIALLIALQLKDFFHDKNLIHCDINPRNIIYNAKEKTIQLIDFELVIDLNTVMEKEKTVKYLMFDVYKKGEATHFGLKKLPNILTSDRNKNNINEEKIFYSYGHFFGTRNYAPPEILNPYNLFSKKTDIFSLGMTLYEIMALSPNKERASLPYMLEYYKLMTRLCHYDPRLRPSIENVINELRKIKRKWEVLKLSRSTKINSKKFQGNTALIEAIIENDVELIKKIIVNKNLDINEKNNVGKTALTYALETNNIEAVMLLLGNPLTKVTKKEVLPYLNSGTIKRLLLQRMYMDKHKKLKKKLKKIKDKR